MSHIQIPKGWELPESDVTLESVFLNRRDFLKAAGFLGAATVALSGCAPGDPEVLAHRPEVTWTPLDKTLYPAQRNLHYKIDRKVTAPKVAGNFNNYYEFSETKEDVNHHARALPTQNWTLEVEGLVNKPQTFGMEDLLKLMPLEERFYRMRCVEAWAMVVPWTGFPLKALLDKVEPQSSAKYVEFSSFYMPFTAQGQLAFWQPWPYSEVLSIQEAMNELTMMATGIYGHPLPKQHGAPLRLVVPWKYGFKSIKAVASIRLTDYGPPTFWNTVMPSEYGYIANVNPNVPHPRWAQNKEKMLGTGEVRYTKMHNGYGDFVSDLYT